MIRIANHTNDSIYKLSENIIQKASQFAQNIARVPLSKYIILYPLQVGMLAAISYVYSVSIKNGLIVGLLTGVAGAASNLDIMTGLMNLFSRLIPGLGTSVKQLTTENAAFVTEAIGRSYRNAIIASRRRSKESWDEITIEFVNEIRKNSIRALPE